MVSFFIWFPDVGMVIVWERKGWIEKRFMK
jgi:hypothetical protein